MPMKIKYSPKQKGSLKFQKATANDVKLILEIEKTTLDNKTYHGLYTENEIKDYLKSEIINLIKEGDEVAGLVSFKIKKNQIYIGGLIIKPEFQRKGLGRQVMKKLLEELKKFEKIDLVVHPDNTAAVKLYKSIGFTEMLRKDNYYGDGEPRLILVLNNRA
jgi:[ribosomal protein S18]-alanine N-acetyltransferase